ncbi:MAG: hypothetical protein GY866_35670, partial [Proteobacteria bacterium]|nr:hypothetical protein [Pseudomonadota bacterium]
DHLTNKGIPAVGTVVANKGRDITLKKVSPAKNGTDLVFGYGQDKEFKLFVDAAKQNEPEKTDQEKHENRSRSMKGNKNAWKGGPKEEPKKAKIKVAEKVKIRTKQQKEPKKAKVVVKPAAFTVSKKKLEDHARTGRNTTVITARSKEKHQVKYKVIEADDKNLIASNHTDGRMNEAYPQLNVKGALQMRDRSSMQSQSQIAQMSNALEPLFLTDSKIASDGAPITGTDYTGSKGANVVESGNGRIMAIRTAYENGKADHYKEHLIEEAETFGIHPDTIKGMKKPILIRERVDTMSDDQKARFAKEANKSTVSQMTAIEQATEDSNFLGELSNLKPSETGRITSKNNNAFIQDFFGLVMDNDPREIGKYLTKEGMLNDEGERRLTNAVFVRVYGADSDVMNKLIMKDSDTTKKITSGMLAAAPRMAKLRTMIDQSGRHDLDIAGNVIDALTAMEELKKAGITLEDKLAAVDWTEVGVKDDFKDPLKDPNVVEMFKLIR